MIIAIDRAEKAEEKRIAKKEEQERKRAEYLKMRAQRFNRPFRNNDGATGGNDRGGNPRFNNSGNDRNQYQNQNQNDNFRRRPDFNGNNRNNDIGEKRMNRDNNRDFSQNDRGGDKRQKRY